MSEKCPNNGNNKTPTNSDGGSSAIFPGYLGAHLYFFNRVVQLASLLSNEAIPVAEIIQLINRLMSWEKKVQQKLLKGNGLTSRQNFIALFMHSTFTVPSQNTIYSGYNGKGKDNKNAKWD